MAELRFLTPILKQSFVTVGVSMNLAGAALVFAYTAGMLPQLRRPDSDILVDESTGSWIAAAPGMSLLLGNLLIPVLMSRYGRKNSNIISIITFIIGWLCIVLARNVIIMFIGRFIQGIAMGAVINLGPILVAEYTSPKNRGPFLMAMSVICAIYVLFGHVIGTTYHWHVNSIICMILTIVNLPIVIFSPESPTWLADKERYKECKVAFRWLRGDDEEEELQALITASKIANKANIDRNVPKSFVKNASYIFSKTYNILKKKEFYKPVFIMVHLYILNQWGGLNIVSTYVIDIFEFVIGKDSNTALHIGLLDAQRIFSSILAMYIVKKIKRRTMLFSITILTIFAYLSLGAYVYVRTRNMFESSFLGILLTHVHMFTIASGSLPLPLIIAGEIFPLEYKGLGGGLSIVSFAVNSVVNIKTLPYLFQNIGLPGAYCLYAAIMAYCLLILYIFMPETKDRTLQDIEDEFREKDKLENSEKLHSLIDSKSKDKMIKDPV